MASDNGKTSSTNFAEVSAKVVKPGSSAFPARCLRDHHAALYPRYRGSYQQRRVPSVSRSMRRASPTPQHGLGNHQAPLTCPPLSGRSDWLQPRQRTSVSITRLPAWLSLSLPSSSRCRSGSPPPPAATGPLLTISPPRRGHRCPFDRQHRYQRPVLGHHHRPALHRSSSRSRASKLKDKAGRGRTSCGLQLLQRHDPNAAPTSRSSLSPRPCSPSAPAPTQCTIISTCISNSAREHHERRSVWAVIPIYTLANLLFLRWHSRVHHLARYRRADP